VRADCLLRAGRGWLRSGVVAALGAHQEFAALDFGFDANVAEATAGPGIGGLVTDGVLILDIVGDLAADVIHFVESFWKKCEAAGALRNDLERVPGSFGMFFIAKDSDGID
jgi:hypothetical protein